MAVALVSAWTACGSGGARLGAVAAPPLGVDAEEGLREVLELGLQRTLTRAARRGGFAGDPELRVRLPAGMRASASALRRAGMGWAVDEFEASLNRSAELMALEAGPLFSAAIGELDFGNAGEILDGTEAAATRRLREQARDALREGLLPHAAAAAERTELRSRYLDVSARLASLSLEEAADFELEDYVLDQTLEGLFTGLAREEARVRVDPAARTSERLLRLFGSR